MYVDHLLSRPVRMIHYHYKHEG